MNINTLRARLFLAAEAMDAYRIVPRTILIAYGWLVYKSCIWFMALPDPNTQHTFYIGTIIGAAAVVIGLYQGSGRNWGQHGLKDWPTQQIEIKDDNK